MRAFRKQGEHDAVAPIAIRSNPCGTIQQVTCHFRGGFVETSTVGKKVADYDLSASALRPEPVYRRNTTIRRSTTATSVVAISSVRRLNRRIVQRFATRIPGIVRAIRNQYGITKVVPFVRTGADNQLDLKPKYEGKGCPVPSL